MRVRASRVLVHLRRAVDGGAGSCSSSSPAASPTPPTRSSARTSSTTRSIPRTSEMTAWRMASSEPSTSQGPSCGGSLPRLRTPRSRDGDLGASARGARAFALVRGVSCREPGVDSCALHRNKRVRAFSTPCNCRPPERKLLRRGRWQQRPERFTHRVVPRSSAKRVLVAAGDSRDHWAQCARGARLQATCDDGSSR